MGEDRLVSRERIGVCLTLTAYSKYQGRTDIRPIHRTQNAQI